MNPLRRLLDHVNRGFPRALKPAQSVLEQLRRVDFHEQYRSFSRLERFGMAAFRCVLYPLCAATSILSTLRHLPRFGFAVRWTEFFPMYGMAIFQNVPPVEYLFFGFSDPVKRQRAGSYLYWMDQPALQWLNQQRGANNREVQDKSRFAELCLRSDLPHTRTLMEFRNGSLVGQRAGNELTGLALWVKPLTGSRGEGGRRWQANQDGTFQSGHETLLQDVWEKRISAVDCVVQQLLVNHPDLLPVTNGATVVLRLVTVLERSGACTLIGSSVALPQGSAESTTGALACVPHLENGIIAKVSLAGSDASTAHPDTGTVLVGFQLPCWAECCELVLRAHREAFPAFASLGWDVVVTPEGPVLLEANSGWGTMGQQMDFGPLSDTPLGRIAADELERAQCG